MLDLVNVLDAFSSSDELCNAMGPVFRIVGIVIWGIKIIVPLILIVVGMIDLAKAVSEKDENKIKEAQNKLVKRAIAAVLVFLVVTLVGLLMTLVGNETYRQAACTKCINNPWNSSCKIATTDI
ncbi:MAG: hypothetical protein IKR57_04500 [Bacilli bacterium]|nr:hypothetical protein [Bacilli bacterium]